MFKKLFIPFAITGSVSLIFIVALMLMIRQSAPSDMSTTTHSHATSADHAQCAAKIRGKSLPNLMIRDSAGLILPLVERSLKRPLLLIRIPDTCSVCREQLSALRQYNYEHKHKELQIIVFAHPGIIQQIQSISDTALQIPMLTFATDPANIAADQLGAVYTEKDGSITQLHATLVVEKGIVTFAALDITPYSKLQNLIIFTSATQSP